VLFLSGVAVLRLRLVERDEALGEILLDERPVALARIAIADAPVG
jgi:hypothetical protein